jgi:Ca2+/H+ antiporter, TMEM165/GDT1 family
MAGLTIDWAPAAAPMLAAFLAALVEFVEALTIVLAVGTVSGWRPALGGAAAGVAVLAVLVAACGPALAAVPIQLLQLAVGGLLLLFGARWLRKAVLRSAGRLALHDETRIFATESAALRQAVGRAVAWTTAFKAVVLEGLEVIFIVIAVGAAGRVLVPAAIGAALAGAVVLVLGLLLHRPLARVPENALKFAVGAMVSAFGLYWIGEGLGFGWPGGDWAILGLIAGWAGLALLLVRLLRAREEGLA